VTNRYVYGTDLIEQVDPANTPVFYHADGLGSTRALSNLAGQRTDAYSYDVFGALRTKTGNAAQPFTFTGEQNDGELGLVFLRARYYDPDVGRFLSLDPVRGMSTVPETLNRYVYVKNNPVRLTDPSGKIVIELIALGLIGYGIYSGLTEFNQVANEWGSAYGDVLNTAGDPNQQAGDYEQAVERFRGATKDLQRQTLKTALTTPGTSLNPALDLPSTWGGLGFDFAKDWLWDQWVDWTIGSDSHVQQSQKSQVVATSSHPRLPRYTRMRSPSGALSWGKPPSQAK